MKPPYIHMWANHRRKSFLSNHLCKSTSRIKTLSNTPILGLKSVDKIALTAAEALVDVVMLAASGLTVHRNQFDIL